MSQLDRYSDPYDRDQYHDPVYHSQPAYSHRNADPPNPYPEDPSPYGGDSRQAPYPGEQPPRDYDTYPDAEKAGSDGIYEQNTTRAQPGRQGLHQPSKSFVGTGPPPRSTGILRMWRKDERGQQWFRGGGFRSFARICCCCTTIALIMAVSIILAIILYVRPPNIALNSVDLGSNPVSLTTSGFTVNFDLSLSVSNPNWFAANFKQIQAKARYPGPNTNSFGGGTLNEVDFAGYTESTFEFPFTLNYSTALDPNKAILNDIISKCGISGGAKQDITVDYDLHLKLQVLGVTVSPTISSSASFVCPITADDIKGITGSGL